jgi:hypothetical protein
LGNLQSYSYMPSRAMQLQPGRDGMIGRYLRRNDKVWSPPCLITFDTEARRHARVSGEDQSLRLWCARLDDRRSSSRMPKESLTGQGHTGAQLAALITSWVRRRENTWLYAHNLGYDLVTSQLIEYMAADGWLVNHCSTVPDYIFLTLARGRHRITLTDLHHLIPKRLADIGQMLGNYKTNMPADSASDTEWFTYCAQDVDILAEALLLLMGHWDDYGLGNWKLSGAACGFGAMRHTLPPKSITLLDDPAASDLERAAIYGGRRYCWRHGEQLPGRYAELDFTAAHATTAANYPMPAKRGPRFTRLDPKHPAIDGKFAIVIAECEIQTDVPRFPCRINGRVWYPVGRFKTTLASPDIAWARDTGCLVSIGAGQFHYTSRVMQSFFKRVLDIGTPGNTSYHPLVSALWKQWGRSVIGKFAQRGYEVTPTRMLTDRPWYYERATDYDTGAEYWLVHYAGRIHKAIPKGDGSQAYPAVLALIESYERVALGKAAEMLGPQVAIQCDTDGIWADVGKLEQGAPTGLGFDLLDIQREARVQIAIDCIAQAVLPQVFREKHSVQRMAIFGPQNYDAGPHSKQSGRPGRLREIAPGIWHGDIFPAVSYQMAHSAPGVFKTEAVTWTRPQNVIPGWVLADGRVLPVEAAPGPQGAPELVPWIDGAWAGPGHELARVQHTALDGLWDKSAGYVRRADGIQTIWNRGPEAAKAILAALRGNGMDEAPSPELLSVQPGGPGLDQLLQDWIRLRQVDSSNQPGARAANTDGS